MQYTEMAHVEERTKLDSSDSSMFELMHTNTARCQTHTGRCQISEILASEISSEFMKQYFGDETLEFINVPTDTTQRKIAGEKAEDVIQLVLEQLKPANLSIDNVCQFMKFIDADLHPAAKDNIHLLDEYMQQISNRFSFNDSSKEAYKTLKDVVSDLGSLSYPQFAAFHSMTSKLRQLAREEANSFNVDAHKCSMSVHDAFNMCSLWENFYSALIENLVVKLKRTNEKIVEIKSKRSHHFRFKMNFDALSNRPRSLCTDTSESSTCSIPDHFGKHSIILYPDLTAYVLRSLKGRDILSPLLTVQVERPTTDHHQKRTNFGPNAVSTNDHGNNTLGEGSNIDASDQMASTNQEILPVGDVAAPGKRTRNSPPNSSSLYFSVEAAGSQEELVSPKKKRKTSHLTNTSTPPYVAASDLTAVNSQHFLQLFGLMKDSCRPRNEDITLMPSKIFGLYIVKNKISLTCLTVVLPDGDKDEGMDVNSDDKTTQIRQMLLRCGIKTFLSHSSSTQYKTSKHKFRLISTDYLDLFNREHFKALLWYLTFLFDQEEEHMPILPI